VFGPVVALLALALVVRVVLVAGSAPLNPTGDALIYDEHALSIADQGRYPPSNLAPAGGPAAFRPPAYPYLLGAVYKVAGTGDQSQRVTAGRLLGVALGVITVALLAIIAALLWGRTAALSVMGVAAIYPPLAAVGSSLLSEALFTPLVLAAVVCALVYRRSPGNYRWAVLVGALAGLAVLTRTNGLVVVPALLLAVWVGQGRVRWKAAAAVLASCVLVVAPWILRNFAAFDEPILTSQTGYTLAGTYNDQSRNDAENPGAWRPSLGAPYGSLVRRRDLDEAEIDRRLRSLAVEYALDHPRYVGTVVVHNGLRMLEVEGRMREYVGAREIGVGHGISDAGRYAFWIAIALATTALVLVPKSRRAPFFVWMVPVLLIASLLPVNTSARYREPADPFVLLLAGLALAAVTVRLPRRRPKLAPPSDA